MIGFNCTREAGEPDHGRPDLPGTLWWTWTAPADGTLQVNSSAASRLALYEGTELAALTLVSRADGILLINVRSNITYQIAIAGNPPMGLLQLSFVAPLLVPTTVSGENLDIPLASTGTAATYDVAWTAPHNGTMVLGLDDNQPAGVPLLLLDGEVLPLAALVPDSAFAWPVAAGNNYVIRLTTSGSTIRNIHWHLSLHPSMPYDYDAFATPVALTNEVEDFPALYGAASLEPGEAALLDAAAYGCGSVWFSWTAPRDTILRLRLRGLASARVFTGSDLAHLSQVVTYTGSSSNHEAWYAVEKGVSYRIVVFGFSDNPQNRPSDFLTLTMEDEPTPPTGPPPNDAFANASPLVGTDVTFHASTRLATREFHEPLHASIYGGRSVWWKWTAPKTGRVRLLSLPVSSGDHEIGVYRGDSVDRLTAVASAALTGVGGDFAFDAQAGVEYRIAVDARAGGSVETDIELTLFGAQPAPQFSTIEAVLDGPVRLTVRGAVGMAFVLESSVDLKTWTEEKTGTMSEQGQQTLQVSTDGPERFYRIRAN